MNLKTLLPLGIAGVLGLAAALVARNMLANRATPPDPQNLLRTVIVANSNILPGSEINSTMLASARVSPEMAPEGTFANPTELVGRVTQAPIYKGQPVMGTLLAPKGSVGGLQALVPKGMRAITLQVDEFSGVAGFLTPGCRVDVLATMQSEKGGDMIARTVVQNIMVTAVGQRMTLQKESSQPEPPMRSVTLIASPEEAQAIELAAATGRPRLVLRNVRDDSRDLPETVSLSDFQAGGRVRGAANDPFALVPNPPPVEQTPRIDRVVPTPSTQPSLATAPPPAYRNWTVKVIRGGSESEVNFKLPPVRPQKQTESVTGKQEEPLTQTENRPVGGRE